MMNRYFLLDDTHDGFMVLYLQGWQVKTIEILRDVVRIDLTIEPFDEEKHAEYLEDRRMRLYCQGFNEEIEIPENDKELVFYVTVGEGIWDSDEYYFRGTKAQFDVLRFLRKKKFCYEWDISEYIPPTITDIR